MLFKKKKRGCPQDAEMCAYCEHASPIGDSEICICDKKGVVYATGICRKFKFDLLKVKPRAVKLYTNSDSPIPRR